MSPDTPAALDSAVADVFALDRRVEPAEDLTGHACSAECTDDNCTRPTKC